MIAEAMPANLAQVRAAVRTMDDHPGFHALDFDHGVLAKEAATGAICGLLGIPYEPPPKVRQSSLFGVTDD